MNSWKEWNEVIQKESHSLHVLYTNPEQTMLSLSDPIANFQTLLYACLDWMEDVGQYPKALERCRKGSIEHIKMSWFFPGKLFHNKIKNGKKNSSEGSFVHDTMEDLIKCIENAA